MCRSKFFVPVPNFYARSKDDFHIVDSVVVPVQNLMKGHLNSIQFLVWPKIFGPAQNILGPVEGQGKRMYLKKLHVFSNCTTQGPSSGPCTTRLISANVTRHKSDFFDPF